MFKTRHPLVVVLLSPLSLIYGTVVFIRNFCFDTGILKSHEFSFPVIGVGNITVGGTGKTPHVEHIVSVLMGYFRLAVLSRGYKRKTRGFVVASTASGVEDVGDEPLQIKRKFPGIEVAVDENRVRGIRNLCRYDKKLQAVVLDDAFQHRWVIPGISVLLIDFNRPLSNDYLLPAGQLREFASASRRAAIVIITKCPENIKPIDRRIFKKELNLMPWQSLYFSTISYGEPMPVFSGAPVFPERDKTGKNKCSILIVTGIASPRPLRKHIRKLSPRIEQIYFPDHHRYTWRDIERIKTAWKSMKGDCKLIITTEKDAMRLRKFSNIDTEIKRHMYYMPISVSFFEKDGEAFKNQLMDYVRNNKREYILC